jgi:hypothetical protein
MYGSAAHVLDVKSADRSQVRDIEACDCVVIAAEIRSGLPKIKDQAILPVWRGEVTVPKPLTVTGTV